MIDAFTEGLGRVRRAPWVVVGLWLSTLVVALPAALVLHGLLAGHLGDSLMADTAARGTNYDWWNEFLVQASGIDSPRRTSSMLRWPPLSRERT